MLRLPKIYLPKSRLARLEARDGLLFILPWAIGYLLFRLGPLLYSLYLSFTDFSGSGAPKLIGLQNYVYMFTRDPRFIDSVRSTFLFVLGFLPLNLIVGLAVALLMNQRVRGILAFRAVYYLPSVTSGVGVALLWQFIFHKQWGILNAILAIFGVNNIGWLVDPKWVMVAFVIMSLWGVGGSMIIYLSGLQSIPTELYESAAIDGASTPRQFWHITLPMLSPTIFFNLVTGLIGAFQIFESAYVMTGGGPRYATYFFGLNIYFTAFRSLRFGYASTLAWILFAIIVALTIFVFSTSRRWVFYAGARDEEA
ncbi:MAG: Lactose transport system permease protein LacF [Chloroflexi bacterium ADurb.Bin325]|nr:MAG: Lactose transport system permease protein LacF [Chloroflexi bacterium ADurb.Bin325]